MKRAVGVHGVGTYLPPEVRTNEWWSDETVATWRDKAQRRLARVREEFSKESSPGATLIQEAIAALANDPFQGGRERRVMPEGMRASDMETMAAREAIASAGISKDEIDLVLSFVICPDFINVPSACVVHENLGLPRRCQALNVDAVCNSFVMQMTLASAMIASGQARYALLTQASAITRLPPSGEIFDNWFGDAGTAVVLGPVSPERGIRSVTHRTDGSLAGAFVVGVPGAHWSAGRNVAYSEDHRAHLDMLVRVADRAKDVVEDAIVAAGLTPQEIDFYASHQAFSWMREVTQSYTGMTRARFVDHFPWTGTVSAANLPLQLALGSKEGLLADGDHVACFQGGTGMTWSGMVLSWGR